MFEWHLTTVCLVYVLKDGVVSVLSVGCVVK